MVVKLKVKNYPKFPASELRPGRTLPVPEKTNAQSVDWVAVLEAQSNGWWSILCWIIWIFSVFCTLRVVCWVWNESRRNGWKRGMRYLWVPREFCLGKERWVGQSSRLHYYRLLHVPSKYLPRCYIRWIERVALGQCRPFYVFQVLSE